MSNTPTAILLFLNIVLAYFIYICMITFSVFMLIPPIELICTMAQP